MNCQDVEASNFVIVVIKLALAIGWIKFPSFNDLRRRISLTRYNVVLFSLPQI